MSVLNLRSQQAAGVLDEAHKLTAMARIDDARGLFYVVEDRAGNTFTGAAGTYLERTHKDFEATVHKAVRTLHRCDAFKDCAPIKTNGGRRRQLFASFSMAYGTAPDTWDEMRTLAMTGDATALLCLVEKNDKPPPKSET